MSSRSQNQEHPSIPTYIDGKPDGTTRVRCRRVPDAEFAQRIINADAWRLSTPDLRAGSAVAKRLARRLRALRLGLELPDIDWQTGECDQFNLNLERLDLMLEHGRDVFLGTTQHIDSEGIVRDVVVVALAPCESRVCDVVVDLDRSSISTGGF